MYYRLYTGANTLIAQYDSSKAFALQQAIGFAQELKQTVRIKRDRKNVAQVYPDGLIEEHKSNPSRFKRLESKLAKEHGGSPSSYGGLAAYIGRKKYGAKKFEAMAKAGRKKVRKNPRETATIPVRGIKIAKNGEIQILANPSSKRKLSNLAKRLGGKLY